jgi:hypothetical protein
MESDEMPEGLRGCNVEKSHIKQGAGKPDWSINGGTLVNSREYSRLKDGRLAEVQPRRAFTEAWFSQ